ncbi:hypothetical protein RclHR1_18060003 [Rhizophagus clarus]|uniref:Uncharacterized protein n=1 Tax=Rhizophagus clarus TaxID=94130 RepID=A0A2Z6QLB2_9GLOM|nr:hypothetical protein RclHR1_18060003 [Rhizophagus clarus]
MNAKWILDKETLSVRSTKCESLTANIPQICNNCNKLKTNKQLLNAIDVNRATPETAKYIPKHWLLNNTLVKLLQNPGFQDLFGSVKNKESDMWIQLVEYGRSGKFNNDITFCNLAQLMLQIKDIEERGKSKRGLRYSEHLHHFFSLLSDSSKEYQIFKNLFVGMDLRSIRYLRTKDEDKLTNPNLVYENVARFARAMNALNWNEPVVAMTDCTKVRSKLTYSQKLGCIVRFTMSFEESHVDTYSDIHEIINNIRENNEIASQVRCILLKIPITRIPPVVITLLPTKGNDTANEIYNLLYELIKMTIQANLKLISIASDGAASEFNAQMELIKGDQATDFLQYKDEFYKINFSAPIYNNRPIIRVQDLKHAKKNGRNNVHSGARLLVLGKDTDDGAAYRFFSSAVLNQCQENEIIKSDKLSLFVYLFVFGELFDAYLNHSVSHKTRIIMAMRAYFFLIMWKEYLIQCTESIVLLIIVYQDYYSNFPFFPWEHGTEAIEHIFGLARQIVPDFTYYEFYKIVNRVMYRDKLLRLENLTSNQGKILAQGYIFDIDGYVLPENEIELLRQWPNDDEISDAIRIAYSNASSFMNFLGIKKQNQEIPVTNFDIILHSDYPDNEIKNNESNEEQIYKFENATSEIIRISKLDETLNELLDENHEEDIKTDNENNKSKSDNECENLNLEFIKSTEIQYILENNTPTYIELPDNEPEELIFRKDNTINVHQILSIQRSHEAYSNSDRIRKINQKPGVNLGINSNDQINRNTANHLITQLNSNDFGQIIHIGCANISQNNPLEIDGFLIIFSDQKLCIGRVLAMYESIGGKHSLILCSVDNIDLVSYISVALVINVYNGSLFTNDCLAGGKLFAHITSKEVVYYLGKSSVTFHNNSMLTLDSNSLRIYDIFNNSSTNTQFASIFCN